MNFKVDVVFTEIVFRFVVIVLVHKTQLPAMLKVYVMIYCILHTTPTFMTTEAIH